MSLAFLLDENLLGPLFSAIERHNLQRMPPLNVVCVGQPDDFPLSFDDPTILLWAERENRVSVSAAR